MLPLPVLDLGSALVQMSRELTQPAIGAPWSGLHDFWLRRIFDDRFLIIYALPLSLPLLLLSGRGLRAGIVLAGLAFVTYVFGAVYAGLWLLNAIAFHALARKFSRESRRSDVWRYGPPVAAAALISGWYLGTQLLQRIVLPPEVNEWLLSHVPLAFPIGCRGWTWEAPLFNPPPRELFAAVFGDPHIIGTAYFVVRMLHYFSELRRESLGPAQRSLPSFLAYVCYAPALMQGPIERLPRFLDELSTCHLRRSPANVARGTLRIGWGAAKSVIATLWFEPVLRSMLGEDKTYYRHPERIESSALLYFGQAIQIFWLYLEFSGYCDISAGIARLLGYRQVENFRWVWFATSMRDFWRRWHISLSSILRDYVYIPLGGNRRHAVFNLCFTFAVCGLWHRPLPQLLLWGILMGLMIAINQRWCEWMERLDQRETGWLVRVRRAARALWPLPAIAAWLLTMHAFVFSLLLFFGGLAIYKVPLELLRRLLGG